MCNPAGHYQSKKWLELDRCHIPEGESLDHAVGLRVLRRGQAMVDAQVAAEQVELVLAGGGTFAKTEQPISEFLAVIGENGPDLHRAGPFEIAQEPAGIGGSLGAVDADKDPAGCPPLSRFEGKPLPGNGSMATNR